MYKLKRLMKAKQISLKELALKSGVSENQIRCMTTGRAQSMQITTAKKLAEALEVSIDELV